MVAGFGVAIKTAAEYEKSLDSVRAVTGSTNADMEKLNKLALDLGTRSIFGPKELMASFFELGKAGVAVKDMVGGVAEAIVNLAAAGDIAIDRASEIAINAQKTFNIPVERMGFLVDQLAGAANASLVDIDDMGHSLRYVGPVAAASGIGIDSLSQALALLGDRGIKGSTAGTSLRGILVQLAPTAKRAQETMKRLGIITADGANQFFDASGKTKDFAGIAEVLQNALSGLSHEQKVTAVNAMFQRRAMASALLLAEQGAEGFENYAQAIDKVKAADVARERLDNLAGAVKIFKANIEATLIKAGTPFQEMLKGLVERLTLLVKWFGNLKPETQKTILTVLAVAGATMIVLGTFAMLVSFIMRVVAAFVVVNKHLRITTAITKVFTGVQAALNAVLALNPIILIVAALVLLIAGLVLAYKKSETFRKFVDKLWDTIQSAFGKAIEFFKRVGGWFSDVWDSIGNVFKKGVDWVKKNWDILLTIFTGPIGLIILIIRRFGDDIVNFFKGLWIRATTPIKEMWAAIKAFFKQGPEEIGRDIGFFIGSTIRKFLELVTTIGQFFADLPDKIWDKLTEIATSIFDFAIETWTTFDTWVDDVKMKIWTFFLELPGKIWGWLVETWNRIKEWAKQTVITVATWANDTGYAIKTFLLNLPGRVWEWLKATWQRFKDWVSDTRTTVSNGARDWVNSVIGTITGLPGEVAGIFGRIIQAIKDKISAAFRAVKDFARGLWDGFKQGLGIRSPSFIEKAMMAMRESLIDDTKLIARQVKQLQGISRMLPSVSAEMSVGVAQGVGAVTSPNVVAAAAHAGAAETGGRAITIENLTLSAIWDMYNPQSKRKIVKELKEMLRKLEQEDK